MNGSAILNETASTPHSWPFHVFIYKHITRVTLNNNQNNETNEDDASATHICSGSLINKRTVLTSASCFYNDSSIVSHCNTSFKYVIDYWAFLGYDNVNLINNIIQHKYWLLPLIGLKVDTIKLHELYDYQTGRNDLALIKLSVSAVLSDTIQTICLPKDNSSNYPAANSSAYAISLDAGRRKLSSMELMIYNNSLCGSNKMNSSQKILKFRNGSFSHQNKTMLDFGKLLNDSMFKYNDVLYFFQDQINKNASYIDFNLTEANFTSQQLSSGQNNFTSNTTLDMGICAGEEWLFILKNLVLSIFCRILLLDDICSSDDCEGRHILFVKPWYFNGFLFSFKL